MIFIGAKPAPHTDVIPVGERVGRYVPVIGWTRRPGRPPEIYAGAGRIAGDVVHLRVGSWHDEPQTFARAVALAREKATLGDWVMVDAADAAREA